MEKVNRAAKIAKIIYTYLNTLKIILREKIFVLKTSMSAVWHLEIRLCIKKNFQFTVSAY